jgi:tRNA1(Val) A37 N6-methylase TrmN6
MAALAEKTNRQLRSIYGLARKIGLDSVALHDIVFGLTKRTSLADLKKHEATVVVKTLLKHVNPNALRKDKGNVIYLVSIDQIEKINQIAARMGWGEEQINKLSQRQYKKPFRHLRVNQAQGLIEGMKSILERKGTVAS